jgi:lysophospholipid acyltransferase (LPLAT)-like uncharacterized protein
VLRAAGGNNLKKRVEQWAKCSLLPPIAAAAIRGVARSMRYETCGYEPLDALYREGRHIILAFWHAQQLMIPFGYRGIGAHVLISQHGDGEIIARIIARFGHEAVRGSSTRGGAAALRSLIKLGRSGRDVVVTPDGPKGPRHVAKLGVIHLAKATGLPIVPLAFACSKKNSLRAGIAIWSRIRFPEVSSSTAPPLWVSREADETSLESTRLELETVLNRLTNQAEQVVEGER